MCIESTPHTDLFSFSSLADSELLDGVWHFSSVPNRRGWKMKINWSTAAIAMPLLRSFGSRSTPSAPAYLASSGGRPFPPLNS